MKVLMVVRLFSGLEESVRSGTWQPRGAPTVYRLIEALDAREELDLWLTAKEATMQAPDRDAVLTLAGLRTPVHFLAGEARLPVWLGRLRWYLSEVRQIWRVWMQARTANADLVYVDRGNLWIAGVLARWGRTPVIYRIMGFSDALRSSLTGSGLRHRINRWLLRSPFAAAICTRDGSGGEQMLDLCMRPDVPKHHLVNGVDWELLHAPSTSPPGPDGPARVLLAGRLEAIKGCEEFMTAFLRARAQAPGALHAVVLGEGERRQAVEAMVDAAGARGDVSFLGSLPHREVAAAYRRADVYVTLNKMGSLSNTTLEALAAGCCIVLPASDPVTHRDEITDALLPSDAAARIPAPDDVSALARTLVELAADPARRRHIAVHGVRAARAFIPTWNARIESEIALLRRVAAVAPEVDVSRGQKSTTRPT